jgi:prephenate dehydrogenase
VRVAVLGVGLIGGSVALAARRRLGARVVGWDPDPAALTHAVAEGIVDATAAGPEDCAPADVWVVAVPVAALPDVVGRACAAAGPGDVVTDVGSTKAPIVAAIDSPRFIGGHPLAGAEAAGVEHARQDLFEGATWYLTPTGTTAGDLYERLHRFVSAFGALPTAIGHVEHDRVMAAVSHLPHVLANVLVERAGDALGGEVLPPTGPSFRDATRVAGANPALWAGIYATNAEALGEQIDLAIARLQDVRGRLGDLRLWQEQPAARRRALLEVGLNGGPQEELRVAVPNRPGVVADLALTLGRAGINIADMSLAPAADNRSGIVALWVAVLDAPRARELIVAKNLVVT